MIQTFSRSLPHGITLSCRATGEIGRPVLLFLHGFPEAAFVWDFMLAHFSRPENGGYRCIAPNLRGFEHSSAPTEVSAYRPKHLVQDIAALIDLKTKGNQGQLAALIAHDWGGSHCLESGQSDAPSDAAIGGDQLAASRYVFA